MTLYTFPISLQSPSGLRVQINSNASIKRIDLHDILINLFLGTEVEGGPANIYLRRYGTPMTVLPLLGPRSGATVCCLTDGMVVSAQWNDLRIRLTLTLAQSAPAWFWHVAIEHAGSREVTVDLLYAQDVGLAHYGAVRLNEYYVSHYLDHTALQHPSAGVVVASRQNLSMGGNYPWLMIGSLGKAVNYATDGLQIYGRAYRTGKLPEGIVQGLAGVRLQHEHAMVGLQDEPVTLRPGETVRRGFFSWVELTKPRPTSEADLVFVDRARSLPEAQPTEGGLDGGAPVSQSLFVSAPLVQSQDLGAEDITTWFPGARRHEEYTDETCLSFFTSNCRHVVLKEKELRVLRPHGHILRTGSSLTPDESALTSTVWMAGVFHSMVTQGHVNINRFLSTTHSYLSLFRSQGLRLFVELDGKWQLLDLPSAFEMAPDQCRWLYRHSTGVIEIISTAPTERHALLLSARILEGTPVRFLAVLHVAFGGDDGSNPAQLRLTREEHGVFVHTLPDCDVGWRFPNGGFRIVFAPDTAIEKIAGDELLFPDGQTRNQPFLCLLSQPGQTFSIELQGCLLPEQEDKGTNGKTFWSDITTRLALTPPAESAAMLRVRRLGEIMPWFVADALIHYLSPRGLEQYSGGGWGTRDVSQGPVEMLLALGHYDAVRDILLRVFQQQNPDGDWPQWFMFFERERSIRPPDSHGDIVFWPVLALSQYLLTSGDTRFLETTVPFFHPDGNQKAEQASVWQHVVRALDLIRRRVIPGAQLAAFGNGDWNDSLQPVQPEMRERLCSSWTVTLQYQTLRTLARAVRLAGREKDAVRLDEEAQKILDDFQQLLIVDDTIAGFGYFHDDGTVEYLLHPRDSKTGISYSLLPMMHALINDMLTPVQARRHCELIREHLLGHDGARLFDRPLKYHGGMQTYFQRAESTTFFGRENGLMYMHAHLRYAEALAHVGDAEGFFKALCQACPIGIQELVPTAALRQPNCYYSSSDPAFNDRYQAYAEYDRVKQGKVVFEGGWRVYSSGAGIFVRLFIQNFLGVRWERERLVIDPVMPATLDGLTISMTLAGTQLELVYRIDAKGFGPTKVLLNSRELSFTRGQNPYRTAGAEIPMSTVRDHLTPAVNRIEVWCG